MLLKVFQNTKDYEIFFTNFQLISYLAIIIIIIIIKLLNITIARIKQKRATKVFLHLLWQSQFWSDGKPWLAIWYSLHDWFLTVHNVISIYRYLQIIESMTHKIKNGHKSRIYSS